MNADAYFGKGNFFPLQTDHDQAYWSVALANELKLVASNTEVGSRNDQLFRSACNIFSIVKAGIGAHENAEDLLIEAARDSGYANDEPQQMMTTLASAWRKAQSRDLTKRGNRPSNTVVSLTEGSHYEDLSVTTLVKGELPNSETSNLIINKFNTWNKHSLRLIKSSSRIGRLTRDDYSTKIQILDKDSLRHEIDRVVDFISKRREFVGVPDPIISHILGAADYDLPNIKGICRAPYFSADGQLVYKQGYDAATEYYLDLPNDLVIPKISTHPSFDDITRALSYLTEIFFDFPFKDKASKRAYLSMLLLPFCRELIQGPLPIYIFAKPAPGTGAGLAVDVFSLLATGRRATVQSEPENNAEFRKNITAFLLSGEPYFFLDNLHQSLDDPAFAGALTAGIWRDRVLGKSEMVDIAIRNMWIVAGNNPMLSEELSRRSVLVSLDAKMARPSERNKFRHPNLLDYVLSQRGNLIWACLTIIQSWVVERHRVIYPCGTIGGADPERLDEFLQYASNNSLKVFTERGMAGSARLASFESWSRTMSGILEAAGVKGLLDNCSSLSDRTLDKMAALTQFIELWWRKFSNSSVKVGSFSEVSNITPFGKLPDTGTLVELLYDHRSEIDLGFNGSKESYWQTKLGSVLTGSVARVFELEDTGTIIKVRIKKTRGCYGYTYSLEVL